MFRNDVSSSAHAVTCAFRNAEITTCATASLEGADSKWLISDQHVDQRSELMVPRRRDFFLLKIDDFSSGTVVMLSGEISVYHFDWNSFDGT